jgi:hypothetical protein
MTRDEIIEEARQYLFVPFRHRGRTRAGLDCLGLGCVVADHFGVHYVDVPDYAAQPHPNRLVLNLLRKYLKPMPRAGNLTGCIGVFAMTRLPCHIGFFTMKDYRQHVLHTRIDCGVAEEVYNPDVVKAPFRLIEAFAFPEMED